MAGTVEFSTVEFVCVAEGRRLRVRIVSPGYNGAANVQFPRGIREAGRRYTAPAYAVTFASGASGMFFYRVKASAVAVCAAAPGALPPVALAIFEDAAEPDCVVCMAAPKAVVFYACGHFYACEACARRLRDCPICRAPIADRIDRARIQTSADA